MIFHHKTVFYEVLEAWSRSESLEIAMKSRMQNMVHFEKMNIIFVSEILFEISLNFVFSRPPGEKVHLFLYF